MKKKSKLLIKNTSFFRRAFARAITAFLVLLTASSSTHSGEDLLDRFFLVRRSDFVSPCREHSDSEAIVIFTVGTHQGELKRGDEFFVITASSKIVRGKVKETLKGCESYSLIGDDVVMGLLALDTPIQRSTPEVTLLGIRGRKPSPSQIGSVEQNEPSIRGWTDQKPSS